MLYLNTCLAIMLEKMLHHELNKHLHTNLDDTEYCPVISEVLQCYQE